MTAGDMVAIYEAKSGRTRIRQNHDGTTTEIARREGREGMICYGTIDGSISADLESETSTYTDGTSIWWRWYAPVSILSRTGFLRRSEVLRILDYKPTWNLRGFGDFHSGLKRIGREEFESLVQRFHASRPIELPEKGVGPWSGGHGEGEGEIHRRLKYYIAENPADVLDELGLRTLAVEYPFATNDRADIVLVDQFNRIVGVEIEPAVDGEKLVGLLQTIKYRHMLECVTDREPGDSRGILIAHRISQKAKNFCKRYGIEHHAIREYVVDAWWKRMQN